jgi:hypothetical protein
MWHFCRKNYKRRRNGKRKWYNLETLLINYIPQLSRKGIMKPRHLARYNISGINVHIPLRLSPLYS